MSFYHTIVYYGKKFNSYHIPTYAASASFFIITAIFLLIYNIADCAGTRPFIFILAKVCLSLLASYILSLLAINLLSYDDRR